MGENQLRGHPIHTVAGVWYFTDTGEPTADNWKERPCGHCGLPDTPEGHDGCLGTLPGVMNACCGHGRIDEAYVQFSTGGTRMKMHTAMEEIIQIAKKGSYPIAPSKFGHRHTAEELQTLFLVVVSALNVILTELDELKEDTK